MYAAAREPYRQEVRAATQLATSMSLPCEGDLSTREDLSSCDRSIYLLVRNMHINTCDLGQVVGENRLN